MTFTEFRSLYPDAFADAKDDLAWRHILLLLDQGDLPEVGRFLYQHFRERKESLEDDINEPRTAPNDADLDDPRRGQAAAINKEGLPAFLRKQAD